jgi:O-antigen ligase
MRKSASKMRQLRQGNDVDAKIFTAIQISAVVITLFILPKSNFDPVTLPKLSLLVLFISSIFLYCMFQNRLPSKNSLNSFFGRAIIIFQVLLVTNLVFNNYALDERLFGVGGRNSGAILYFSFSILSLLISQLDTKASIVTFAYALSFANFGVCLYFLIQLSGNDVFAFTTFYDAPSSTLGNPNLVSGFVGFASLTSLIFIINKRSIAKVLSSATLVTLSLFVVIKSNSIQGLFAFFGSFTVFTTIAIAQKNLKIALGVVFLMIPATALSILGFLGSGPLASLLATTTLFSRFDYWRAAIRMTVDSPFVGKGLDSYGDFYRQFRDLAAYNRFGESQVADSAHNIFLDLFSGGGIPLGSVFLIIQIVPAILLTKKIIHFKDSDLRESLLLAIWVGYTLQSLVSISQVGVGIWGWIMTGLMYSCAKSGGNGTVSHSQLSLGTKTTVSILIVPLALVVSFAPLVTDAQFLKAANAGDGLRLKEISLNWPMDTRRMYLTSAGAAESGFDKIALEVSEAGVKFNPHSYVLWKQIYENKETGIGLRQRAEQALKIIEPRFVKTP